jgi:GH25 family lysozyme M1 (1,4-beta-N-acetylmuramidase)
MPSAPPPADPVQQLQAADHAKDAEEQREDAGRVAGISGDVDLNWFAGSGEDLRALAEGR